MNQKTRETGNSEEFVRLNGSGLRTSGSRGRIMAAVALLALAGAAILAVGSGAILPRLTTRGQGFRSPVAASSPSASAPGNQPVLAAYHHLPLVFEANQGQSDPQVKFLARGSGYGLYLTASEAVLSLQRAAIKTQHLPARPSVVRMALDGANANSAIAGADELPGKSNYFIGNDPDKWHRNVPQFAGVRYRDVYPGIDLLYHGNQGRLEYDFEVAPGVDPAQVTLSFQGPENLKIGTDGDLVLGLSDGEVRLQAPRVYQKFGGQERPVAGRFKLRGASKGKVGFELGAYDRSRTLIIDPVLTYSTYLGGSGEESCSTIINQQIPTYPGTPGCPAIAVDAVGNAYVAGSTTSTDFPNPNGIPPTLVGVANVFVAKFTSSGTALQYSTYIGGNDIDYTAGIAVDASSNVIVAGTTDSTNFPAKNAFQSSPLSGGNHVFVSKLNSTGTSLLYSTYVSGNGVDTAAGVALDPNGNAYVTGTTASTEVGTGFPSTTGAFQTAPASGSTIQFFVTKIDPNLSGASSLVYSTYFGGGNSVRTSGSPAVGGGIAVDVNSDVYITGGTSFLHVGQNNDFPILNAYQGCLDSSPSTTTCPTNVTAYDVFVAKLNPAAASGAQLLYSTYLGGTGDDIGYAIAVDPSVSGSNTINAYATGSTTSTDFDPAGSGVFQSTNNGGVDAFLAKLGPLSTTGTVTLTYLSYLGGSGTDIGLSVAMDALQGARITGWTDSTTNFPVINNPVQSIYGGGTSDAFATRIDTTATAPNAPGHYSTYLGGGGTDIGTSVTVDNRGASYVTGETSSGSPTPFPTVTPFQGSLDGPSDAFVSKLGPLLNMTMTELGSPTPVGVGNQVTFTFSITNNNDAAYGVTFTDTLPTSGATFVSATASPGSCGNPSGGTVLCNMGTLNSGATPTVTVVLIPATPPTPGTAAMLSNGGSVAVEGNILATANASVTVNDYTIAVAPATATVPAGVPATYTVTVTPTGSIPTSISIACGSGLPTGATCLPGNNNPIPNLNNGPQSSQLIINTTQRVTTTTRLWHGGGPVYAAWLPLSGLALLGVGIGGKRSRRRRLVMGALLAGFFTLILFQAGCGSSSSTTTTTGTPAGSYSLTVNATSGNNAVRTATVTLVVQ
jgi:hypothetical protein